MQGTMQAWGTQASIHGGRVTQRREAGLVGIGAYVHTANFLVVPVRGSKPG